MKSFVALCAVLAVASASLHPPAPLNPDGTVAETPEVAAVRAARLSELAKAGGAVGPQIAWGWAPVQRSWAPVQSWAAPSVWWSAGAPLNADGTVAETADVQQARQIHMAAHAHARASLGLPMADTPEVEAAKAAHFAAHQAALSRGKRWAPLNPDGTVADTPEVALAKAQHLAEVAKARGILQIVPVVHGRWWGPSAPLNPDGTVADTAEVRAAKAIHFAAHAGARLGVPVLAPLYHGLAPLNIDGTVAETPEVVARKIEHFAAHGEALARLG